MAEKSASPVAVVGMACRLPGGIDSPDGLWEALISGADLITEIPADRWDAYEYYDPEWGVPGRSVSKWGGFIDDIAGFDFEFFAIPEQEARAIDPQHRLLLETSWEALEHAGIDPATLAGSRTGVFTGLTHNDYAHLAADAHALEGPYGYTGTSFSLASGRIAYALGVHGPAVSVDTACSSGLTAIHAACRSLNDGESDLVLAGAVSVMLEPRLSAGGSSAGMFSPTGHCHSFDVDADGFVSAEGCVVVTLKRLDDALGDGDRILAVIRGTAANHDGRTVNIATPSGTAQESVFKAALAVAGVDAASVGMVEAHGTGTPVGDPIEFTSLAKVYGTEAPCALGSAKANFGHAQAAAGGLGLMKVVLALRHGLVPQNLHHTRLPDQLAAIETKLFVPQSNTDWPGSGGQPRRAAVSAYGLSGTNVHVIVEQAPQLDRDELLRPTIAGPLLYPLSSTSAGELRRTAGRLADWVTRHHPTLESTDLAYTLARRRAHRPIRTAVLADGPQELITRLHEVARGDTAYPAAVAHDGRGPVWVFSGHGSQWAGMGAQLLTKEPVFASTVAAIEPLIARESGFSVAQAMSDPQTVTTVERVQPTIFAFQVALAATMRAYGVVPGAVIGHSMGEVAASVIAEALTLEDGVKVVCRRSALMRRIAGSGAMASVELPARQVRSEIAAHGATDVVVAVIASPQSTVIGGPAQPVRDLVAGWEQRGIMAREVAVDVASHSSQVDPILDDIAEVLADLHPMEPTVPYYSATRYDPCDAEWDADYWVDNLRQPVRFAAAVQAALEDGHRVFAELSPHPLLTFSVEQTARSLDVPLAVLATVRRQQELPHGLRDFVADLYTVGAAVDFSVLYPAGQLVDAPLPTWTHTSLLLDRDSNDRTDRGGCTISVHPLLGSHIAPLDEPDRHLWRGEVGTEAQPWLADHQVHEIAALPGAAYCEMALAAARTVLGDGGEVRDVCFEQMLLLDAKTPISASAAVVSPGVAEFTVDTYLAGDRTRRAHALLEVFPEADAEGRLAAGEPAAYNIDLLLSTHPHGIEGSDLRLAFNTVGIAHLDAFAGVARSYTADAPAATVLSTVRLPGPLRSQQGGYEVHPALLDSCFQTVVAHPDVRAAVSRAMFLPLGVRRLRVHGPARNTHYCYTQIIKADPEGIEADLELLDARGRVLLSVLGLQLGTGASEAEQADRLLNKRLLTVEWRQREIPGSDGANVGSADVDHADAGSWLLIVAADNGNALATSLADALKSAGAECTTMIWPQHGDDSGGFLVESLASHLARDVTGVVVVTGPPVASEAGAAGVRGGDSVRHLVRIARELPEISGQPRLYVVTHQAQMVVAEDVPNLEQAGLRGLLRVIGAEYPRLRASQIDVDAHTDAELLIRQLLTASDEDETAWRNGQWYTARLCPAPLRADERHTITVENARGGMRLQIRTPGDLETLESVAFRRIPPGPGQIEVAVSAASINFADVLAAFGRCPSYDGKQPELGSDFGGVVTAVGPGVTNHRVGDRVGGAASGCWGTFVTCDANQVTTLPAGLGEDEAAAVGLAYVTVWHGLEELARIGSNDKVLIHSATGGVGQAAIWVARAAGAQIFATAGSEERRQLLRDWGIQHVYDSRSLDFADQIRRDTDGYGVDIVLNSLTGPAQRAGLELLTFGGRFVEIGKRDIYADTRVGLFPFRRNLSFFGVDIALMIHTHPDKFRELLQTVFQLTADGSLPLPGITHYPLADAATAIREMGAAQHTGKLVLQVPRMRQDRVVLPPEQVPVFRSDGAYIVTGGLGGLGLFLAEKMAKSGCGRIVLTSRRRPSVKAREIIELICATGADIVVECGDIAAPGTADRLVAVATATGLPLRGVLHAAAVVEDATLLNITDSLVERDWAPKVYGAWRLHEATLSAPLDWFCAFSSAAALLGSRGQGAYAAANSWLDAFMYWRRAQGLPGSAIAWGAWAEIGLGTALAHGDAAILPDEGAYAFEKVLGYDRVYTGYTPVLGVPWLAPLVQHSPFAEAFKSSGQGSTEGRRLRADLAELPTADWPTHLRRLISEQVGLILRRGVDPDRQLSEYGLDSLGNLELRTRIEAETGIRISAMNVSTVRALAETLCETLTADQDVAETAPA